MFPDFAGFKRLSQKGNLIAVLETIPADLETPVSSFLKLARNLPHTFLLESAEQEEKIGRYSFIGLDPKMILKQEEGRTLVLTKDRKKPGKLKGDLLDHIETKIRDYRLANPEVLPGFCGGFVGFLSYENVQTFEDIQLKPKKETKGIPEGIFFLTEELVLFDHFRKTLSAAILVEIKNKGNLRTLYRQSCRRIEKIIKQLRQPLNYRPRVSKNPEDPIQSNMSARAFKEKVRRIKEYIRAGDCIQVVLSQRFTLQGIHDDFPIYRALRSINPSPYMFYFRAKDLCLIGSSPELLVKKTGRSVELRPIAGTRPRGETPRQDLAHEEGLRKSRKETAEHLMLVDLGRNDLGRVCRFDSIRVKNFARVERYSHVMHLVSDVVGTLRPSKTAFDLLRATFPAGTVSGAPKIRAMQIIDELEPEKRGPYAGCLGYFSFNHDMDMCITIRTLVLHGRKIYLQAGAGIVKDSSPEKEYQETVHKAKALLKAVAGRGDF